MKQNSAIDNQMKEKHKTRTKKIQKKRWSKDQRESTRDRELILEEN